MAIEARTHLEGCRATIDNDSAEFISGAMAALVNIVITFPINKIMFRQMVHGFKTPAAVSQLKNEGLATLYKGCLPPLIQKTVSTSIMFGTYAAYQRHISTRAPNLGPRQQKILAALLAGTTEALLCPLERAQCLLQDVRHQHRFRNTAHVFSSMRTHGLSEYYRGLSAVLLRNGPSTMMFFTLRDIVRDAIPLGDDAKSYQKLFADFLSGSLTGAFVSTIFYPVNVTKINMQVEYGTPHLSMRQALRLAFETRDRSLRKLFSGVHLNYSRAMLSWGITNAAYEVFKQEYETRYRSCDCL
ncbi:solute carrier family 25 member 51 [Galendromus occidentalis]|uniref:Solute carrier family 25 member 51 n=1 Tax=Galendromus occidentalis TaxID=34638 RepID=A0AAJ6VZS1_9ACAR|nr:solute carrier family 25 member 51 [Galendromus occidentalis]